MMEKHPRTPAAWMISPRFLQLNQAPSAGMMNASLIQVLFPIPFLEWVTSAKRYRVTLG
jgi:hypothetical protein